jgi:hypothetical protein
MRPTRMVPAAALATAGAVVLAVAAVDAPPQVRAAPGVAPAPRLALAGGPDSCGDNDHLEQQGGAAGTSAKVCQGGGPVFIGPAVGQVAAVIGPTVIGPAQVAAVVSAGNTIQGF